MTVTTSTAQRPIPGPRGLPILGMMPEMIGDMLGLFMDTTRDYGGIAQFKLLNKSYLLVTNPDYVKYILQDNYKNYIRGRSVETGRVLLGNGLPLIDGDFWHGWRFPLWKGKLSERRAAKIELNRARDCRNFRRLRRLQWKVVRIWEHQIEQNPQKCLDRVLRAINDQRGSVRSFP